MFTIRDIDHLVLRVVDLERMLRFYCEGLGLSLLNELENPEESSNLCL